MAPFHAMAELNQIVQAKILMSQILMRKRDVAKSAAFISARNANLALLR